MLASGAVYGMLVPVLGGIVGGRRRVTIPSLLKTLRNRAVGCRGFAEEEIYP